MISNIVLGFTNAFELSNIFAMFIGLFLGTTFGAIPGLGPTEGVALLIPFTYRLDPIPAILLLSSIYMGGTYGGQIAAILLRIPGAPEAVATLLDGNEMVKKGQVGKAFGIGLIASVIGSIFGAIVLMFLSPQLSKVALNFGPAEYFALSFLGLSAVSGISTNNPIKAIIACLIGLLFATVGIDPITGVGRFNFGSTFLLGGIPLIPALIGLFAVSEVLKNIEETHNIEKKGELVSKFSMDWPTFKELIRLKWILLRCSILGVLIGVLPGVGATTAAILAYNQEVRLSKNPEKFGTGIIEGIAAPEVANNAAVGGAMVPLLSLGIPGSATTAVILGALILHGMRPGPLLILQQAELCYSLFAGMFLSSLILIPVALITIKLFSKVLYIPYHILTNIIICFSVIGSLVMSGRTGGIWIMLVFGIIGYLMNKFEFPPTPILLGLVLGPLMESSLRRALLTSNGNIIQVISRPLTLIFLIIGIAVFFTPYIKQAFIYIKNKKLNLT